MKLLNNSEIKEISGARTFFWFQNDEINVHLTHSSDSFIWHGGSGVGKIAINGEGRVAAHKAQYVDTSECPYKVYAQQNYTVTKKEIPPGYHFILSKLV